MTTKERIVRLAISHAESERKQTLLIIDANPYSEILKLEEDTIERCKELNRQNRNSEAIPILQEATCKRNQLLQVAKKQQQTIQLLERISVLDGELSQLYLELHQIERKK